MSIYGHFQGFKLDSTFSINFTAKVSIAISFFAIKKKFWIWYFYIIVFKMQIYKLQIKLLKDTVKVNILYQKNPTSAYKIWKNLILVEKSIYIKTLILSSLIIFISFSELLCYMLYYNKIDENNNIVFFLPLNSLKLQINIILSLLLI